MNSRYSFVIKVRSGKYNTYRSLHARLWSVVLGILNRYNIKNYSIFFRDYMLFSYYEYCGDNYVKDIKKISRHPATKEWWKITIPCQIPIEPIENSQWWAPIQEIFYIK
jgi:L-rhamnose mutarotase